MKDMWSYLFVSTCTDKPFFCRSDLYGSQTQRQACLVFAERKQSVRGKHLGSAANLTTGGGDVTQTLNYLPYGEDWLDVQHNMDPHLSQYRFNGKEKDYESGFHYYGARYYWSDVLTGWLSVDPMADKYPSISPYTYCHRNPIALIDPDGREDTDFKDEKGTLIRHLEDGSDAQFVLRNAYWDSQGQQMVDKDGKRVKPGNAYFEFVDGDANKISVKSVIDFAQEFCQQTYTNDDKTYCNFAAGFIIKSFVSACENKGFTIDGDISFFFDERGFVRRASAIFSNIQPNALYSDAVSLSSEIDNDHVYLGIGCFNGHVVTFLSDGTYSASGYTIMNIGGRKGNSKQNGAWLNNPQYTGGSNTVYYTIGAFKWF